MSNPNTEIPNPFTIALRANSGGPVLAREPLRHEDFAIAMAETWRDVCLRGGECHRAFTDVPMRVLPLRRNGLTDGPCRGFAVEAELQSGAVRTLEFSLSALRSAAHRLTETLVAEDRISSGQSVYYELSTGDAELGRAARDPDGSFTVTVKTPPLDWVRAPLQTLIAAAKAMGECDEVFPVFFTTTAFARAEMCSRRGAASAPPVESGGVLIGSLVCDDDGQEFFVVVSDVLEAGDARKTAFTLSYSGSTWTRIQAVMKARQAAHPEHAERLVGQCHGHNFLPNTCNACDTCDKRATCELSSVFVSREDCTWMSAVFSRQPWALCQIFGLSARKEPVQQLYSLKDARWQPRGYYLLPDSTWDYVIHHPPASQT